MQDSFSQIIDDIAERGWSVQPHFFEDDYLKSLSEEVRVFWREGGFREARIGTKIAQQIRPEIRSDFIYWLEPENLTDLQRIYWDRIDNLRLSLNRELYLGLQSFEAHFAVYPPGSFYKKHIDQFRSVQYRLISCILYLNFSWKESDGGQLRIYLDSKDESVGYTEVYPEAGTFVCFRSDTVYHEVLPGSRERFSLTGWLRRDV